MLIEEPSGELHALHACHDVKKSVYIGLVFSGLARHAF